MDEVIGAAVRKFPERGRAIHERAGRDETFRELCADFATAEDELRKWSISADPWRDQRIEEYSVLVEELGREIEATLDSSVIAFPRR